MSALLLANPIAAAFVAPVQSRPTLRVNTPMMAVAEPMAEPPAAPKPMRKAEWNPNGLTVPSLPGPAELFSKQFEPVYLRTAPAYLDGELPGDIGFDPWALTVLAAPPLSPDKLKAIDAKSRTASERNAQMLAMSEEEQQAKIEWMRNSEIKHGRLAMLAIAGWPMAEFASGRTLAEATNGRAPSLFNGHLLDYTPFLAVVFGGMAAMEFLTKDKAVKDGDYGFDPLGFASGIGADRTLKLAEVKHGRAAMMGITGFAVQEFFWGTPVVQQTPFFFLPFGGFTG